MSYTWYASLVKFLLRFEIIKAHFSLFRLSHFSSFRPILSSYRIILNLFRVFWGYFGLFRPILNFSSFRLIRAHLGSFQFISLISLQFTKKNQMYQYLFYDYHLVYILATVWDTSMSISNSAVFLHTVLDPLKSNSKQTFVWIQLLGIDYGRSLFSDSFLPDASTLFPYYRWLKTPEV